MVKTQRLFTLDIDLHEKLSKESNASSLINDLIKKHYELDTYRRLPDEEREKIRNAIKERDKLKAYLSKYGLW